MFYDVSGVAGAEPQAQPKPSVKEEAIGKLLTLGVIGLGVWAMFFREPKPARAAVEYVDDDA